MYEYKKKTKKLKLNIIENVNVINYNVDSIHKNKHNYVVIICKNSAHMKNKYSR